MSSCKVGTDAMHRHHRWFCANEWGGPRTTIR